VCLKNDSFVRDFAEVRGFNLNLDQPLAGLRAGSLPAYIPVIEHGSSRQEALDWPVVALPLRHLLKKRGRDYVPVAATPDELREWFKVAPSAKVVVRGTGLDKDLERYWEHARMANAPEGLVALDLLAAVPPNFSHFLEDPRPTHLANTKRSVMAAANLSEAGLAVLPYLAAIMERDYERWEEFLLEHPEVEIVAEEFGTGLARPDRALPVLDRIVRMQARLGRPLHLVAIAGAQFVGNIAARFEHFTIIDTNPFFKAIRRQMARLSPSGVVWEAVPAEDVSGLLYHNVAMYSRHIASHRRRVPTRLPIHPEP